MLPRLMKWITMASLLIAVALWRFAANSQLPQFLLGFIVCFGAVVVAMQAVRARKYLWAGGFGAIALLFNPIVLVFPFGGEWGRVLVLLTIALFAVSLATLRAQPLLSIPSITDRTPGSQSL